MKVLIAFGTSEGQTAKISEFMAKELRALGHQVTIFEPGSDPNIDAKSFVGIIVGAPVHGGQFPKSLRQWVIKNRDSLTERPTAFFSVCLGILQKENAKVLADEKRIVTEFLMSANWHPSEWAIFAGALAYSKYGWIKKRIMRSIARKAGTETQIDRDYEYTDWEEVKRFTQRFANRLASSTQELSP